jgi:hypothetical protein
MSACYGAGVRGMLPYNLFKDEESEVAFMRGFAELGLSAHFRDVIGDRVADFTFKNNRVKMRWLDGDAAAPVLAAYHEMGGSAPYSLLEAFCSDDLIFIPNFYCNRGVTLDRVDEGHPFYRYPIAPLEQAIRIAESGLAEFNQKVGGEMEAMLLTGLLRDFRCCDEHHLMYHFGY